MGTNNIAELPNNPPNVSDRIVVGSRVATDTILDDDSAAAVFVNISVGGTLTHFAAPPVLMVAGTWEWDIAFMFSTFGWRSAHYDRTEI